MFEFQPIAHAAKRQSQVKRRGQVHEKSKVNSRDFLDRINITDENPYFQRKCAKSSLKFRLALLVILEEYSRRGEIYRRKLDL